MINSTAFIRNQIEKNGSFKYSPQNEISNLYSSCFGILSLNLINELENFENKEITIKFINKHQDKNTGYFIDQSCIPNTHASHDSEYIYLQLTDFAQLALSSLNACPNYKYKFLKRYKNIKYLKKWFYGLNWKNPWYVSNIIMFVLNCFIYENRQDNQKYINFIMELLQESQDKNTGFWNLNQGASLHNQMAGAYHFIIFYTFLGIQPNYIKKIIDSTLLIQEYDGLFNYQTGGGSCDDLDAIDLLCRATFYTNYRKNEIERALRKSYLALLKNQNKDGGFCWAKRDRDLLKLGTSLLHFKTLKNIGFSEFKIHTYAKLKQLAIICFHKLDYWRYSGLDSMKIKTIDSDLFSTWFRLNAIALIETTFPKICNNEQSFQWNMRKKSGLGFYKI